MTNQPSPLVDLVAQLRAKAAQDEKESVVPAMYRAGSLLNYAADRIEAELAKLCDSARYPCEPDEPNEWGEYIDGVFTEITQVRCLSHIADNGIISSSRVPRSAKTDDEVK